MSHFTVMVVTDSPDEAELHNALQPFHQYECTGVEDQYVTHVDVTEEVHDYLYEDTLFVGKNSDGEYDYGYNADHAEKLGLTDITEMNALEYFTLKNLDPDEQVKEYFGNYERKDNGKWYRYTNPNYKWDWWIVGGRWAGSLQVKPGAESGVQGRRPLIMKDEPIEGVDQCRVADLDLEAMVKEKQKSITETRMKKFTEAVENVKAGNVDAPFMLEDGAFERWDMLSLEYPKLHEHILGLKEEAKNEEALKDFVDELIEAGDASAIRFRTIAMLGYDNLGWFGVKPGKTLEQELEEVSPIITYAVLMDGQWYQRGEMGWWGITTDEDDQWDVKFKELFDNLDPEKYITIVDCHI